MDKKYILSVIVGVVVILGLVLMYQPAEPSNTDEITGAFSWRSLFRGSDRVELRQATEIKPATKSVEDTKVSSETNCKDSIDEDLDGKTDCEDPECMGKEGPMGFTCCFNGHGCGVDQYCAANKVCADYSECITDYEPYEESDPSTERLEMIMEKCPAPELLGTNSIGSYEDSVDYMGNPTQIMYTWGKSEWQLGTTKINCDNCATTTPGPTGLTFQTTYKDTDHIVMNIRDQLDKSNDMDKLYTDPTWTSFYNYQFWEAKWLGEGETYTPVLNHKPTLVKGDLYEGKVVSAYEAYELNYWNESKVKWDSYAGEYVTTVTPHGRMVDMRVCYAGVHEGYMVFGYLIPKV
jgi:hypothetical protein